MLLRRVMENVRTQNWTAVFLDFVIVVVGVFIGIQVANWNSERALREREQVYLQQLLIDLESDIETGARGVASADQIDVAAQQLIALLQPASGTAEISNAELMRSLPLAGYAYLPYTNSTTYNEMISTGALGLIQSVTLKRALGDYYARGASGRQWDSLIREEQHAYRAAIRGLLTREQFAWARANTGPSSDLLSPPPFDRAHFLAKAHSRPAILDSLHSMGAVQQRLRDDSIALAERAKKMAKLIEKELRR